MNDFDFIEASLYYFTMQDIYVHCSRNSNYSFKNDFFQHLSKVNFNQAVFPYLEVVKTLLSVGNLSTVILCLNCFGNYN